MAYITDENGNYKRTVRCGHCYEKEHNKSACPKRKQDLKENVERYTKELAEDKFVHDYQRDNTKRYLRHSVDQLEKMANRGKNRKCGFCGDPGHTRRTCTYRKAQVSEKLAKTLDVRSRVAKRMVADGFGPGTLINVGSADDVIPAVIQSVSFHSMEPGHAVSRDSYFQGHRGVVFQYVVPKKDQWGGRPATNGTVYIPFEYLNIDDIPKAEWYRAPNNQTCSVLSGIAVSEDFLLDSDAMDVKKVTKYVIDNIVDPK